MGIIRSCVHVIDCGRNEGNKIGVSGFVLRTRFFRGIFVVWNFCWNWTWGPEPKALGVEEKDPLHKYPCVPYIENDKHLGNSYRMNQFYIFNLYLELMLRIGASDIFNLIRSSYIKLNERYIGKQRFSHGQEPLKSFGTDNFA